MAKIDIKYKFDCKEAMQKVKELDEISTRLLSVVEKSHLTLLEFKKKLESMQSNCEINIVEDK